MKSRLSLIGLIFSLSFTSLMSFATFPSPLDFFLLSAQQGDYLGVRFLVRKYSEEIDLNKKDPGGNTPLILAAKSTDFWNRWTPQFRAFSISDRPDTFREPEPFVFITDRLAVLDFLLKQPKIDVNAKNNQGETALIIAARYANQKKVRSLLAHPHIDTTIQNNDGETALDLVGKSCIHCSLERIEEVYSLLVKK